MTVTTAHLLDTEYKVAETSKRDLEDLPMTQYRPVGIVLQNDGVSRYWLLPGEGYEVEHDGTGWRVTCRTWADASHVYRLAREGVGFVSELPAADGPLRLVEGQRYTINQHGQEWRVEQV